MKMTQIITRLCAWALVLLCSSFAAFAQTRPLDVWATIDPGVDPTGTTDSSAGINRLLSGGNLHLRFPCGTFKVSGSALRIYDNTYIRGQGECTVIITDNSLVYNSDWQSLYGASPTVHVANIFANVDFSAGNQNIRISNLKINVAGYSGTVLHVISFVKSSHIEVDHIQVIGDGASAQVQDGINFVYDNSYYSNHDNYTYGLAGACSDEWGGGHDFTITNNKCDGANFGSWGIVVNGISSGFSAPWITTPEYNYVISNNELVNWQLGGIQNAGITTATAVGVNYSYTIANNIINGVRTYFGIYVGEGHDGVVSSNTIMNTSDSCIAVLTSTANALADINIHGNHCNNPSVAAGRPAYRVGDTTANLSTRITLEGNSATGTTPTYSTCAFFGSSVTASKFIGGACNPGINSGVLAILQNQSTDLDRVLSGFKDYAFGRLGTKYTATSNTTLTDTGLAVTVPVGTYAIHADASVSQSTGGGAKMALSGTASGTLRYSIEAQCDNGTVVRSGSLTSLNAPLANPASACTGGQWTLDGTIVVTTGGTLSLQFAQATSDATGSSVLVGSYMQARFGNQ